MYLFDTLCTYVRYVMCTINDTAKNGRVKMLFANLKCMQQVDLLGSHALPSDILSVQSRGQLE